MDEEQQRERERQEEEQSYRAREKQRRRESAHFAAMAYFMGCLVQLPAPANPRAPTRGRATASDVAAEAHELVTALFAEFGKHFPDADPDL